MEHKESTTERFEKFTWMVENFSSLNVDKIYSEPFIFFGYPWKIVLYPKGNVSAKGHSLSIYLKAMQTANTSKGWSRDVKLKLLVFNQVDTNMTISKESNTKLNANVDSWGFAFFMKLTELHDPEKGFIVNGSCLVGAEVFVSKSTHEKPINQSVKLTASLTFGCQTNHIKVEELVCDEPTKQADAELVSAALGRVLYFLKTRKVKDMNEQACKELQVLWDELDKYKFDLTWLEPQVRSALGMKNYVEKTLQVEKLNVKLAAAELSLDVERELLKAQGIKERDLESELGSGF